MVGLRNVFIVNRNDMTDKEAEFAQQAPPFVEFNPDGNVVNSFVDWNVVPNITHGCTIDNEMPPWRQLPTEDLRALIAYIHGLHLPGAAPSTQDASTLDEGKSLFAAKCTSTAAGVLAPSPTNFHPKRPTQERVWDVLENGMPGTAMPP